jgi:hypothetical protein
LGDRSKPNKNKKQTNQGFHLGFLLNNLARLADDKDDVDVGVFWHGKILGLRFTIERQHAAASSVSTATD